MSVPRRVLVCQNKSCQKQGATKVLAALQTQTTSDVQVEASSCLGQCGNGPMMLVLPEEVWYCRVQPDEVGAIAERHLKQGNPVKGMLYRKFHPADQPKQSK
ncbi:(2Fe-2S) ferredoxin domain-containing protein [Trichocoleus desertorum AS-A10]|uniref:(2Fe-2S) ferredoxin domain-containing protein n=1 Tax=Trichocoleus desertorum TaxID=1481672 RepID=UPI0032980B9D